MKKSQNKTILKKLSIAIVCPHIFMQDKILPLVLFSPGHLAISLANGLVQIGHEVTLFSPGKITTLARNETVSIELLNEELQMRNYDLMTLMQKHPLLFATLARQIQTELLVKAFRMANENIFDVVHVYMNEEEIGLSMSDLCNKPIVFTHHEPFNFLARYRTSFPKYKHKNWISISYSQRKSMPAGTNWVGNVYHGFQNSNLKRTRTKKMKSNYVSYFGRIIEPKGVHLAIEAVKEFNKKQTKKENQLILKIAGKYYNESGKDMYWKQKILPLVDGDEIQYIGFLSNESDKQDFLAGAMALLVPSTWEEPFGMVMIEALSVGTPIIGLNSGAISEVIRDGVNGFLVAKHSNESVIVNRLKDTLGKIKEINRAECISDFYKRFTVNRMVEDYVKVYNRVSMLQ